MKGLLGRGKYAEERSQIKRIYLHIGHYKTGTTALQWFLAHNRRKLAAHSIDYLEHRMNHNKHSVYAFSVLREAGVKNLMHGFHLKCSAATHWSGLFDAVRASAAPTCLISSEEFIRFGAHDGISDRLADVAALGEDIEIRVIVYLRPPDSHIRSWYNQLVKMGQPLPGFNTAVTEVMEPIHYDYALALRPWVDVFGPEAVIVRPYGPMTREDNDLYADFLSIFDIDFGDIWLKSVPGEDPNPRMDDRHVEFVRLMQNAQVNPDTVGWARKRAQEFLDREIQAKTQPAQSFDDIMDRAAVGLDWVGGLPHCGVDIDAYAAQLPNPAPSGEAELERLSGFLLGEIRHLRQTLMSGQYEVKKRLEALEAKLGQDT